MKNLILFFASFLLFSISIIAQEGTWKLYQSIENINDITERDHKIWLATDHGIVIIDKTTHEKTYYNRQNSNLPADHIAQIVFDPQGNPWIGTYDLILSRFDGNNFVDIITPTFHDSLIINTWSDPLLYEMIIDANNIKWLGTNNGLMKVEGEIVTLYNHKNTILQPENQNSNVFNEVWKLDMDEAGNLYFTSSSLFKYDGNVFTNLAADYEELFAYGGAGLCVKGDRIWYHNFFQHIAYYENETWTILDDTSWDPELSQSFFYDFTVDQQDDIYLPTNNKIYKWDGASWNALSNELSSQYTHGEEILHFDDDNNAWLSNRDHIVVVDDTQSTEIAASEYLIINNNNNRFVEGVDGELFIVNQGNLITFHEENGWFDYSASLATQGIEISVADIAFNSQNEEWIIAYNPSAVYHRKDNSWEFFDSSNSILTASNISKVVVDQNDHVWVSSIEGLFRYDGNSWVKFTTSNSILENNSIADLLVDDNNVIWLKTNTYNQITTSSRSTIYRITDGNWVKYNYLNSLIPDNIIIRGFSLDNDNNLWAIPAYYGGNEALFKFDGEAWTAIENFTPSESILILQISYDNQGRTYVASSTGLHIKDGEEWTTVHTENSDMAGDFISSVHPRADGNIWLNIYYQGVNVFYPASVTSTENILEPTQQLQCFPNPAHQQTTIEFELETNTSLVELNLINLQGQIVQKVQLSNLNAGKHQHKIDVSKLNKAPYFLELKGHDLIDRTIILVQ